MGTLCTRFQSSASGPLYRMFSLVVIRAKSPPSLPMKWCGFTVLWVKLQPLSSQATPLAFNYCILDVMVIYSREKWHLNPEIPLNLWHLQSTFLIGSCFIPSNVSFLFLWTLWHNRDYFADKMCVKEEGSEKMLRTTSARNWRTY